MPINRNLPQPRRTNGSPHLPPITISDALGREVTFEKPERIAFAGKALFMISRLPFLPFLSQRAGRAMDHQPIQWRFISRLMRKWAAKMTLGGNEVGPDKSPQPIPMRHPEHPVRLKSWGTPSMIWDSRVMWLLKQPALERDFTHLGLLFQQ